jgi:hypothetical protein
MTTAAAVAKFMADELERTKYLYQDAVVNDIIVKFGEEFTRTNENGNLAINKDVLAAFNKLTPNAVWDRGERLWRGRESYDKPGRQQ